MVLINNNITQGVNPTSAIAKIIIKFLPIFLFGLLIPVQYFFETGIPILEPATFILLSMVAVVVTFSSIGVYALIRKEWVRHVLLSCLVVLYIDILGVKLQLSRFTGDIHLDLIILGVIFILLIIIFYFLCCKFSKVTTKLSLVYFVVVLVMGPYFLSPPDADSIRRNSSNISAAKNKMPPIIHIIFDEFGSPKYIPRELSNGINYHNIMNEYLTSRRYQYIPEAFSRSDESSISITSMMNFDSSVKDAYSISYGDLWKLNKSSYYHNSALRRCYLYLLPPTP